MTKKPEILSPAGDMDSLQAALSFGADAVFLAGKMFGMRSSPRNFDADELRRACALAHAKGKKIHVTCNILPRNSELKALPAFLMMAQDCGVDALIIADLGVLEAAKRYAPRVARHISTQAGVTNYAAANALYQLGASRVAGTPTTATVRSPAAGSTISLRRRATGSIFPLRRPTAAPFSITRAICA